jgi:hypothetical protein
MAFNKFSPTLLAVAFSLLAGATEAQLYKWTDANGKVHYSDTVPPADIDRARRELRKDGTVKKDVERAQTPEERRAAALKAAEEEKERVARAERERRDKALLATYATLADFDRVRDRALAVAGGEIDALKKSETTVAEKLAGFKKQVDPNSKRPVPPKLKADIDASEGDLKALSATLAKKVSDRETMTKNYASERIRLADLIAAEAAVNKSAGSPASAPSAGAKKKL